MNAFASFRLSHLAGVAGLASTALGITITLAGCGGSAPPPRDPREAAIVISESPPPAGYVGLRPLVVTSGDGCGLLGTPGSEEGARANLRRAAVQAGASYVQITFLRKPPINHQCREHEFKMGGIAYRRADTAPRPAAGASAASSAPAPVAAAAAPSAAPARACIPGATQACLGPGACQGAQACREDGVGFLPCDCGTAGPSGSAGAAPAR